MTIKRYATLAAASLACISSTNAFSGPPSLRSFLVQSTSHKTTNTLITNAPYSTSLFSTPPERNDDTSPLSPPLSTLVSRVAVAGATGRTGKFVVQSLLSQKVPVLALVRDPSKASTVLDDPTDELLTIRKTDLGSRNDVLAALDENQCDAAIWCATGFSDAPDQSIWTKLQALFGLAVTPKGTIDAVGLPALAEGLKSTPKRMLDGKSLPKIVMLSSAGVTRPSWSEEKKLALEGCAGIPIVRLNPFGILDVKRESEETLRTCGEF